MTATADSLSLLWLRDPSTWLLVRMVQSTEDARKIADEIPPSDLKFSAWDREVFNAIANMASAGRTVTPRAVYREIAGRAQGKVRDAMLERAEEIGRLAVDNDCLFTIHETPLNDDIERYVEWSTRERFADLLSLTSEQVRGGILELPHARAHVENGIQNIQAKLDGAKVFDDLGEQIDRTLAYLADPNIHGLPFGIPKLDKELMPLLYSHLVLIGGATGSGKSTIARNLLRHWVGDLRERVALHTIEMSADEQLLNLGCMTLGIDLEDVIKKRLSPHGVKLLHDAVDEWRGRPLKINDRSSVTPAGLLTTMRRYRSEGFRIQIVDHLHHIEYDASKDKRIEIGNLARSLKTFAQDTDSIVLALVQLTKMPVHMEPDESKIREAADIGEAANQILLVYKPLVACERPFDGDGELVPIRKKSGLRYFEGDKAMPKEAVLGFDREHVYLKPSKQRIRPKQALFALPFNEKSGLIYSTEREP